MLTVAVAADDALEPPAWGVEIGIADADGTSLAPFHAALKKTAKGKTKTRILQFGASHTAADLMTGYMRRELQERFGDGGHGWFMPARPWRTYRHQDLKFENSKYKSWRWEWDRVRKRTESHEGLPGDEGWVFSPHKRYGLAGMSVTANSKKQWAKFRTGRKGPFGNRATSLQLFYRRFQKGGDLYLRVDGAKKPQKIRTRGKAGLGTWSTGFADRSHEFELKPRGNGSVTLYGGVLERTGPGIVVDTLGINGARAASMLRWDKKLWAELVQLRDPALIILAYGTNESGDTKQPISAYRAELKRVLKRVRTVAPNAACVLFGPTDRPFVEHKKRQEKDGPVGSFRKRDRTAMVVQTQREVAKAAGCGFFDAVGAMGGDFSIVAWADAKPRLAYADYVHLTNRGYARMAELFVAALLKGYAP